MSNETPDPHPRPAGPDSDQRSGWFFPASGSDPDPSAASADSPDSRRADDADVPELADDDPLIRSAHSPARPHDAADRDGAAHPSITPTPMPSWAGGTPVAPMPQSGGPYPAQPMPRYQSHHQPFGWHQQPTGWPVPPQQYGPPSTTAPAADGTRRRRSAALVAGALVLALGAGLAGGYLGADLRQEAGGSAVTASSVSRDLTQTSAPAAPAVAGSVESVAAAVLPSVVSVVATSSSSGGEGSGVILTTDGYIVTNNHVVEGATSLSVRFNDGSTATAELVGADTTGDIAVLKVDGVSGLTAVALGDSDDVRVGEEVVAIGSPLGLSATVTSGIVSALNRPVRTRATDSRSQNPFGQQQSTPTSVSTVLNAVQTDASINPGNSGGALVNMQGQLIGINTAIASLSSGSGAAGSIGVGFAIPVDTAARIAQEIIDTGTATYAVLGASVGDAGNGPIPTGAEIKELTAGGAAEAAGLRVGDVVTEFDGNLIESSDALVATVRSAPPGSRVEVTVLRGSTTETVPVTLGSATN